MSSSDFNKGQLASVKPDRVNQPTELISWSCAIPRPRVYRASPRISRSQQQAFKTVLETLSGPSSKRVFFTVFSYYLLLLHSFVLLFFRLLRAGRRGKLYYFGRHSSSQLHHSSTDLRRLPPSSTIREKTSSHVTAVHAGKASPRQMTSLVRGDDGKIVSLAKLKCIRLMTSLMFTPVR